MKSLMVCLKKGLDNNIFPQLTEKVTNSSKTLLPETAMLKNKSNSRDEPKNILIVFTKPEENYPKKQGNQGNQKLTEHKKYMMYSL